MRCTVGSLDTAVLFRLLAAIRTNGVSLTRLTNLLKLIPELPLAVPPGIETRLRVAALLGIARNVWRHDDRTAIEPHNCCPRNRTSGFLKVKLPLMWSIWLSSLVSGFHAISDTWHGVWIGAVAFGLTCPYKTQPGVCDPPL